MLMVIFMHLYEMYVCVQPSVCVIPSFYAKTKYSSYT
jgi:hypothetical protein